MDDLISRQVAIDALGERPMVWTESDYELGARNQYDADVLALKTVPSVQKKGRWNEDRSGEGFWICSNCGFVSEISVTPMLYKFCPQCGTKMDSRAADIGERK